MERFLSNNPSLLQIRLANFFDQGSSKLGKTKQILMFYKEHKISKILKYIWTQKRMENEGT